MENKKITVTSPLLPPLDEFEKDLRQIWDSKWVTNQGSYHEKLEAALAAYLGVEYINLFTNGTIPLITALEALDIKGEVITTPYSFVATTHAIRWNGLTPVFADIDEESCNLDPQKVEDAITPKTSAIMPVHVYGRPCDTEAFEDIARRHDLKVIYDAAHAFGVRKNGVSVLEAGDISTLSFHATKVYNTLEGGALVCHSPEMKTKIDHLKNFGFEDETTVIGIGINGKIDEVRSAYGLLNLRQVDDAIAARRKVALTYRQALAGVPGIRCAQEVPGVDANYSYFPIFIDEAAYGMSRDALYEKLKSQGILSRRYFYPLISDFPEYRDLESARNLPVARKVADGVICLPMHHGLDEGEVWRVVENVIEHNR